MNKLTDDEYEIRMREETLPLRGKYFFDRTYNKRVKRELSVDPVSKRDRARKEMLAAT